MEENGKFKPKDVTLCTRYLKGFDAVKKQTNKQKLWLSSAEEWLGEELIEITIGLHSVEYFPLWISSTALCKHSDIVEDHKADFQGVQNIVLTIILIWKDKIPMTPQGPPS